jgi:hypothetical protein
MFSGKGVQYGGTTYSNNIIYSYLFIDLRKSVFVLTTNAHAANNF